MTGYTPQQILVALGKARRHAWLTKKTVHVVENDGFLSWLRGPLISVDEVKPDHIVVIRDVHPQPQTGEMVEAYCKAVLHDPHRTGHIADALRGILNAPAGQPLETEAVALLLWDLAAQISAADHKARHENMKLQFNIYRRDLPGYQEPRR
ncbi:hypothetical protein DK26_14880 [Bosea sp. WAO]|uniref:hypothetical protein n=1 Tax=Bosea sp. WAO TaxID=406341 RepID=UPI00074A74F9|nr:hypothetical protein [Bosea sp. WAO]KUL94299.1 hypothetical protein DK26_14880 [Bosea sp. WAO]